MSSAARNPSEGRPGHIPALAAREWLVFALLAGIIAATNMYVTLLTGWGSGGSLIAVIASLMVLRALRHEVHIQALNLGQTMASAGAMVGFSCAAYAAVRMVLPEYRPSAFMLYAFVIGAALIGVVVAAVIRGQLIRYYFPTGTACAIIQRTVSDHSDQRRARRMVRLLFGFAAVGAAWTVPVKTALEKGGAAILDSFHLATFKGASIGVSLDPVLFGTGMVVGPHVGFGMLLGALAGPLILQPALGPEFLPHAQDWTLWCAVAALTLPSLAAMAFAYLFRERPVVPPGFSPGQTAYQVPARRGTSYGAIAFAALLLTVVSGAVAFELSVWATILAVAACGPLAAMTGRVVGETDINPVILVIVVLLTVFVLVLGLGAKPLLGIVIMGSVLVTVAVDMAQDYRTGYLVDANPTHQISVQFVGVVIGASVAVPLMLFLDGTFGFGQGEGQMAAPGPTIYATLVHGLTQDVHMPTALQLTVAAISVLGCAYAFFTVWPKTARYMPSLVGAGIGLLVGFEMSAAIFLGSAIRWVITRYYVRGKRGDERDQAARHAGNDTLIVGSALFMAGAIMTIILVIIALGTGWFHIAT